MIDNIRVSNYENSLFMIKPDAYKYRNEIIKELLKQFKLVELEDVILTEHFLSELYQSEKTEFRDMNVEYMKNRQATIGIVSGADCKKKLFEVCGTDFRAEKCKANTIRYRFNVCQEPIMINGHEFYINSIHRASPEDADKEIRLYRQEYIHSKQIKQKDKDVKKDERE